MSLNAQPQTWVRGAVTLQMVSGEVEVTPLGEATAHTMIQEQLPVTSSGLINCAAAYGNSALFSTSNRNYIYFEGDGSFSIERFEQVMPDATIWDAEPTETGKSRMIVNFRAGNLIFDSRAMYTSSQLFVETPLGRLSVTRALLQMHITFDPRSQIFDFTITCTDGRVRFTDLQGQQYTLRAGQRLAGAGTRKMPSIEVGERTERSFEQMERYQSLADLYLDAGLDLEHYLEYLRPIETVSRQSSLPAATESSVHRPIIIEYAVDPDLVTPFRGETKRPSAFRADLF
jgi:hypothetical protein